VAESGVVAEGLCRVGPVNHAQVVFSKQAVSFDAEHTRMIASARFLEYTEVALPIRD
jgi:hypothetical protein